MYQNFKLDTSKDKFILTFSQIFVYIFRQRDIRINKCIWKKIKFENDFDTLYIILRFY